MRAKNPVMVEAGKKATATLKSRIRSREARAVGMMAEKLAKEWLESKGFKITDSHTEHPSNKYYDFIGEKGGKRWVLEVKSGKEPQIKLKNFEKALHERKVDMFGLILVTGGHLHLLPYNIHRYRGELAWKYKRAKGEWWDKKRRIRLKAK